MRKNLTKEKIKAGQTAYGVFVNISCPSIVEIVGLIGFDFALFDTEHGPMDIETCEHMVRAADSVNITPIIRIAVNIQQNILRYLDIGTLGVLMPMLYNKADVESVVRSVKYRPEGRRGLAGVRANGWGIPAPLSEYVVEANRELLTMVQIETMEAVENLEDFLTIPEIDVVFVGPTDLSAAMGYPGQVKHPEVQEMVDKLVKKIRAAGKAAGTVAYDIDTLRKRKEQGFQFIVYNAVPMLVKSGREYLQVAKE
ncbi:MAG: HpcH/HpaI aldolase/citrate lyase family protein [Dehalococcoidales bacterium]